MSRKIGYVDPGGVPQEERGPAMSDEQAPRRDPGGAPGPDETREFAPFDDEPRGAGNHPVGGLRSDDDAVLDRTQQMPPVAGPGADPTVVARRDATAAMPPAAGPGDATAAMPPARDGIGQDAAWSGRAEVRPPRREEYTAVPEWDTAVPPTEPRGRWWMPILLGILALLLLGALIWGIYLIAQNSGDGTDTPAPTPTAPAPTTVATTEPTTTPPTTTPATTPTTTEPTGPTEVTVPALVGLSQREAQQALDRRGLSYRLLFRPSDAQPGTVIDSDPAEGQEVPPDTQVTLVIAAEAATTTPPTDSTDQPDED